MMSCTSLNAEGMLRGVTCPVGDLNPCLLMKVKSDRVDCEALVETALPGDTDSNNRPLMGGMTKGAILGVPHSVWARLLPRCYQDRTTQAHLQQPQCNVD